MSDGDELGKEILDHLRFFQDLGVNWVGRKAAGSRRETVSGDGIEQAAGLPGGASRNEPVGRRHAPAVARYSTLFDDVPAAGESLDSIREDLGDCRRCKLADGRSNIVFGSGNPDAELMFVGEAPGAEEDAQGLPFVGRAGRLLTKIIEAINMRREDVYICNILKCRPPGNRNPESDEIASCEPFLMRQIASVGPAVICTLGTFGAQTLLKTREPISRLRGHFIDFRGSKLIATYHPAYLLRNPNEKRKVWEDIQKVRDYLVSLRSTK
jgi:DNA polymerase